MNSVYARATLLALWICPLLAAAQISPQPEGIQATHRSGQTFITWSELPDSPTTRYRVYRHSAPITGDTLGDATLLREIPGGSARWYANYYMEGDTWQPRWSPRLTIQDGGPALAEGQGLLVWTLEPDGDLGGERQGLGYYAVTSVGADGAENRAVSASNTLGPVQEQVDDPLPIRAHALESGGWVYVQYANLRRWNPTFHAPAPHNRWLGFEVDDPTVQGALAYAYDYRVFPPLENCGDLQRAPIMINLHGHGGDRYGPNTRNSDPWWCAYNIYMFDQHQTWYFGFERDHDYQQGPPDDAIGAVANYTERRLLGMVHALSRVAMPGGPPVDQQRIYLYGHSMGGSGTLALSLRYPNVFAAAYASEPMTRYSTSGDGGGVDWRGDVSVKWGSLERNYPVSLDAPNGWADHLKVYDDTGVWDWQDHQTQLQTRRGDEMVPLGVGHGVDDRVIEWATQGSPFYSVLDTAGRPWGGVTLTADHHWLGFRGLPPSISSTPDGSPFQSLSAIRDETVPGLSRVSSNSPLPADSPGRYNLGVRWSSSWQPFDGSPIDEPLRWGVTLCSVSADSVNAECGSGPDLVLDVTPRRAQRFQMSPGQAYAWTARRVADDVVMGRGVVEADEDGLVTVEGVEVDGRGTRIIIESGSRDVRLAQASYQAGEDAEQVILQVVRTGQPEGEIAVSYATVAGSAEDGVDYSTATGTLRWMDGDGSPKIIAVPLLDNEDEDGDRAFEVQLSEPQGTMLGQIDVATVEIIDDEMAPAVTAVEIITDNVVVAEDEGVVRVEVRPATVPQADIEIEYATEDGIALGGEDFEPTAGTLSWAVGDNSRRVVEIPLIDDEALEGLETFEVALAVPEGAEAVTLAEISTARISIVDDDEAPVGGAGGAGGAGGEMPIGGVGGAGGEAQVGGAGGEAPVGGVGGGVGGGADGGVDNDPLIDTQPGGGCSVGGGALGGPWAILTLLILGWRRRQRA